MPSYSQLSVGNEYPDFKLFQKHFLENSEQEKIRGNRFLVDINKGIDSIIFQNNNYSRGFFKEKISDSKDTVLFILRTEKLYLQSLIDIGLQVDEGSKLVSFPVYICLEPPIVDKGKRCGVYVKKESKVYFEATEILKDNLIEILKKNQCESVTLFCAYDLPIRELTELLELLMKSNFATYVETIKNGD